MPLEKNKFGIVYDLECGYCRALNESLMHFRETDIEGAKEIVSLKTELKVLKIELAHYKAGESTLNFKAEINQPTAEKE